MSIPLSLAQRCALDCVQHYLSEGSFLAWNGRGLEVRELPSSERLWRNLLSWTGICDTTAQRCAVFCKKTFEKISAITPTQPLNRFDAKIEANRDLKAICYKVWQSAVLEWMKQTQGKPVPSELGVLLSEANQAIVRHNHDWNKEDTKKFWQGLAVACDQQAIPLIPKTSQRDVQVDLSAASILTVNHLKIEEQGLRDLVALLKSLPSEESFSLKEVEVSIEKLSWPHDAFDYLEARNIRLIPTEVKELRVNQIREKDDERLANCLLANSNIDRLYFPDLGRAQALPRKVAEAIKVMNRFEWIDFGSFIWPLTHQDLPLSMIKLARNECHPFLSSSIVRSALDWKDLINPKIDLGSRIVFKILGENSLTALSLPLGFVRRLSGQVHHDRKMQADRELFECENRLEWETLRWLFKIHYEGLPITGQYPQPNVEQLLFCAKKWHMRSIIEEILSTHRFYWCPPSLLENLHPVHSLNEPCSDLKLTVSMSSKDRSSIELSVDRYALALSFPQRLAHLAVFYQQTTGDMECDDPRVDPKHLAQYYAPNPLVIDRDNFESFWVLALSYKDKVLLEEVGTYFSRCVWPSIESLAWKQLCKNNEQFKVERWLLLAETTAELTKDDTLARAIRGRFGSNMTCSLDNSRNLPLSHR